MSEFDERFRAKQRGEDIDPPPARQFKAGQRPRRHRFEIDIDPRRPCIVTTGEEVSEDTPRENTMNKQLPPRRP